MLGSKPLLLAMLTLPMLLGALFPWSGYADEGGSVHEGAQPDDSSAWDFNDPDWSVWKWHLGFVIDRELYKSVPADMGGTKYSPLIATVLFKVTHDGKIKNVKLRSTSGDARYDKFALNAVQAAEKRIKPFPIHQTETDAVFIVRLMYPESSTRLPYYFFLDDSIAPDFIRP